MLHGRIKEEMKNAAKAKQEKERAEEQRDKLVHGSREVAVRLVEVVGTDQSDRVPAA